MWLRAKDDLYILSFDYMSLISILFFLAALIILLTCLRRGADIFSPARVFGFIWAIAIGLADLKLSRLQHEWDLYGWITLLLGVCSFLVGVLVVNVLFIDKKMISLDAIRSRFTVSQISESKLLYSIIVLFCAYVVTYVIEWSAYGRLPLFAANPDRARMEIGIFGIHLFIASMPILLFLIVEYLFLVRKNLWRKGLLTILFTVTFISYFFLLNRLHYVMFVIITLAFAFYTTRIVTVRNVMILVASLIACLSMLQYFREARYAEHFLYVISDMKYSRTYAAFTGPYMYIVMNLENFARAVGRVEQFSYGYFTFDFLTALTGLKHPMAEYFGLDIRVALPSGYNTYPFMWNYYYDFGLAGVVLFSLMLGSGISLLHRWMRQQPNNVNIAMYSAAVFVMVLSFFTNILSLLNFMFDIGLLLVIQAVILRFKIDYRWRLP